MYSKSNKFLHFLGFWVKNFREDHQKCFLCVHSQTLRNCKIFVKNSCLFEIFGQWAKNVQTVGKKKLGGVVGTAFYVPTATFRGKLYFFKKKSVFLILFGFWGKKLPKRRQNCIVRVHSRSLRIDSSLYLFLVVKGKFFEMWTKNIGGFVETACYMCRGYFWLEFCLKGKFFLKLFSELDKKRFELSVTLFSVNSVETVFYVSLATFSLNLQSLTKSHKPLLFFDCGEQLFGAFSKNFSAEWSKLFMLRVHRNIRGEYVFEKKLFFDSFSEFYSKMFRCLAVLFGRICQNWLGNVRRKFMKWIFFNLKIPTSIVELWTKNVRTFCRKLLPVHQDSFLRIKPFLWRKTEFLQKVNKFVFQISGRIISVLWARDLRKNSQRMIVHAHLNFLSKFFLKKDNKYFCKNFRSLK